MLQQIKQKINRLRSKKNISKTLRLIWSVARRWTMISIGMILLETVFFGLSIYLLKMLVNVVAHPELHGQDGMSRITKILIGAASATVVYGVIRAISAYTTEMHAAKVSEFVNDKIHDCAINLDLSFYESPAYFDVLKRAKEAGTDRPNAIVNGLIDICKNLMLLLAIGSVLFTIDPLLLPLLVLFVLPTLFVKVKFSNKLYNSHILQTPLERKSFYLGSLITSDTSAKEIRSFGLGGHLKGLYSAIRMQLLDVKMQIRRNNTGLEIATNILAILGFFGCIAYISIGTLKGRTSVGDITLFLVAFPQSFTIMQALSSAVAGLYQNNIFVSSIFELFELKPSLQEPSTPVPVPQQDIEFTVDHVGFTYPHADRVSLVDISMVIPAGNIVAVVGLNGAGKTTLIKLLNRLYDPSSGSIKMNGIDIRRFDSKAYRKQVSTVFQDFSKYNLSVSDNIRFGDIDGKASLDRIADAAEKSGADSYIEHFTHGYDTMMGRLFEDGEEVSIGQWQKLAIARALYSPAQLLILDEPSSALDTEAETELFTSFRQRIGNRSALVISHRLSAIRHADLIYVISEGRIQQSGTHDSLLEQEGDYARLFGHVGKNETEQILGGMPL